MLYVLGEAWWALDAAGPLEKADAFTPRLSGSAALLAEAFAARAGRAPCSPSWAMTPSATASPPPWQTPGWIPLTSALPPPPAPRWSLPGAVNFSPAAAPPPSCSTPRSSCRPTSLRRRTRWPFPLPVWWTAPCGTPIWRPLPPPGMPGALVCFVPCLRPALWPGTEAMAETVRLFLPRADVVVLAEPELPPLFRTDAPRAALWHLLRGHTRLVVLAGAEGVHAFTRERLAFRPRALPRCRDACRRGAPPAFRSGPGPAGPAQAHPSPA